MEILLLLTIVVLQLVLIVLVLRRQPQPVLESPTEDPLPGLPREETVKGDRSESLWDEPSPPSEELRYTIKEFKSKYNRNDSWDGDFVL